MNNKKQPDIIIVELMLVRAGRDFTRTFMGEIYRETAVDGSPLIHGKVVVNEGMCYGSANSQEELAKFLNSICTLKLDYKLHSDKGVKILLSGINFFLN